MSALRASLSELRARGMRSGLVALGIAAAAAMLGTGVTVVTGLTSGFDRAAERARLPDVIARFDFRAPGQVDERLRALPNLAAYALRTEVNGVSLSSGAHASDRGAVQVLAPGPHGYAVVAGRDLRSGSPGVVVERGLARAWHLRVGSRLRVGRLGAQPVVGVAVGPDNVAFPLARAARVYVDRDALAGPVGGGRIPVNMALLWAHDRARLDVLLAQARVAGYGLKSLRFVTRSGVRVLLDEAAGVVIALLVAFALVTLAAAGVMLGASASAEVQRGLTTIGVLRALGFSPGQVARRHALSGALVAGPAAAVGLAVGTLAAATPTGRLLERLNELPPGAALLGPLAAAWLAAVALVAAASAWPAWRAARRPIARLLGAGDLAPGHHRRARGLPAGWVGLGVRLALARPARLVGAVGVLAASGAVVLLMLALAGLLEHLRDDPAVLGRRYALTSQLPPSQLGQVRALPGVAVADVRYSAEVADSFQLGERVRLIAIPGDHTRVEAPALAAGRRLRGDDEVEVGVGLAQAIGMAPGGTLAVTTGTGREIRFRVVGLVRALENDGRVAYVRPPRLLAAEPGLVPAIAVRLAPGASREAVAARLAELAGPGGPAPRAAGGATTSSSDLLGVLATLLRVTAAIDATVCLYALMQVLALAARERRATLAVLRACGAGRGELVRVLGGVSLVLVVLAAPLAVALERGLLGPAVARLAADYGDLSVAASADELLAVGVGFAALALVATLVVAGRASRLPVVAGLRSEAA